MSDSRVPSRANGSMVKKRRDTFAPRQTFPADDSRSGRRSSAMIDGTRESRVRDRSRPRSVSFDGGETEIRESMPHRREKDKAWWEGRR